MIFFLGFAIPFAVALDLSREPRRDSMPSAGQCCLCKRHVPDTYQAFDGRRFCADDVAAIVHRTGPRRVLATPRPVGEWPLEKVAEHERDLVALEPSTAWWDRQLA